MRLSLPLRLFAVHLLFMVGLGFLAAHLVQRQFTRYQEEWTRSISNVPTERLFDPLAAEVARSFLLRISEGAPETQTMRRDRVTEGLDTVLPALPSIRRLAILGKDNELAYVNDAGELPLRLDPDELAELPDDGTTMRRAGQNLAGERWIEESFRVLAPEDGAPVGAVLLQYDPGEAPPAGVEPYRAWMKTIAWSLLDPPAGDSAAFKTRVSSGLQLLLPELPIDKFIVVDAENRIQYANDVKLVEQGFRADRAEELFGGTQRTSQTATLDDGTEGVRVVMPIYKVEADDAGERERLGTVLLEYRPDERLESLVPALNVRTVGIQDYLEPLAIFLIAAVGGGILISAATSIPVRRLEKAFIAFRERGFRGGFDPTGKMPSELKETVRAIEEMGGQLEQLDARGVEREALLASLSQSLEDGMLAVDEEGTPLAWNPAALRLLAGSGPTSLVAGDERTDIDRKRLVAALARNPDLQFALDRVALGHTREVELVRHDGWTVATRVTQVPVELRPGLHGFLLLIRDVGALRRVERHLLEAGRFAALTHLAAGLAHEIRNPLHAIRINADVVGEYTRPGARSFDRQAVEQSVSAIRDESKRLTDLLNNYLGLVRSGDEFGDVDLEVVVWKVIQLVNYSAQRSHVTIKVDVEDDLPAIPGKAVHLQQAILNLVLNAIQAMPKGGELKIDLRSLNGAVRLRFTDTGPGLPGDVAESLFDTRLTTKPQGTGLGLPLVRLIVETHGGSIRYIQEADSGATFELLLPMESTLEMADATAGTVSASS